MSGKYDDIIHLPHPVSTKHPRMSLHDRAAQFSPFAALTGHSAAIDETARLTDRKVERNEEKRAELDRKWKYLQENVDTHPEITVTHFIADEKKEGGIYVTTNARLKKVDSYKGILVFVDGTCIYFDDIFEIELKNGEFSINP